MPRLARPVDSSEWAVSEQIGARRDRLLDVPATWDLLRTVVAESNAAALAGRLPVRWQESTDRPGFYRVVAQVPLAEATFDQFFNGRSGYRAQYYLSPEEGIIFNRELVVGLTSAMQAAHGQFPRLPDWHLVETSIRAPHSKVWVFDDQQAFDAAEENTLNPPRWVMSERSRGRRVPLPSHLMIDIKGAFIRPGTGDIWVDDFKLDRACDLFRYGFS
jgi:hypothetical protein